MEVNGHQFAVITSGMIKMAPKPFARNLDTLMEDWLEDYIKDYYRAITAKMLLRLANVDPEKLSVHVQVATTIIPIQNRVEKACANCVKEWKLQFHVMDTQKAQKKLAVQVTKRKNNADLIYYRMNS